MAAEDKKLADMIESIAWKRHGGLRFPVMSGTVEAGSVDMGAMTCSVVLSMDDDDTTPTTGIMLNAVTLNSNGLVLVPADGSQVWVCEIDGQGKWGLVKCSDLAGCRVTIGGSTVRVTDGHIEFNGGTLGGLVKVNDLVEKLNNIENKINSLITAINTWVPVPGDGGTSLKTVALVSWLLAPLTDTVVADLENGAVKQ